MRAKHIPAIAIVAFLFVMALSSQDALAQCKSFVKSACLPQLTPFIHDGNYQAVIMSEGEEAEVYKTIFAGQRYRLIICIDAALPDVEFVVSDIRRNILFDNSKNDKSRVWDFRSESSQQIKVTIRLPKSKEGAPAMGCVAVLFGMLDQ